MKAIGLPNLFDDHTLGQFDFTVTYMDHPWLFPWGVDARDGTIPPSALQALMGKYIPQAMQSMKLDYAELIKQRAFDHHDYPNGLFGRENVEAVAHTLSATQHARATLVVGLTGAHFHFQRYNDVLALKCCDARGEPHLAAESDMEALARRYIIKPFVHMYELGIALPHTVDLEQLLADMRAATEAEPGGPGADYYQALVDGYRGDADPWVPVAVKHGVVIEAALGYRRDEQLCNAEIRRGMLEQEECPTVQFRRSGSTGESGYLRLRVHTRSDPHVLREDNVAMNIDHEGEQDALEEVALLLGLWLYRRARAQVLEMHPHTYVQVQQQDQNAA